MKWGVPSYDDGVYYLVALKDHVNLGVSLKGIPVEKRALLDVIGKTTGHVEFVREGDTLAAQGRRAPQAIPQQIGALEEATE